jgi:glutamyl-Q tRNA(Asp) synthetase
VIEPSTTRGRFAPSPTGPLHLGSLVAALASYLMAKSQQGQWIIRIEDLDPPREIAGMAEQQLRSLANFGLHSDLPVVWQSSRTEYYEEALQTLFATDKVFHCSCTRKQLQAQNGIHLSCVAPLTLHNSSIRLRTLNQTIEFTDAMYGVQKQNMRAEVGDVVLKRADGLFAYQLAVVVDDAEQGINQIVRGEDLLSSTPRQIFLQQQLSLSTPDYAHIPLVRDEHGQKLSKSQWAASLDNEDRFNALCAALTHLGQDISVLSRQFGAEQNLQRALQQFSIQSLKDTITRE